jgi:hypothetical protein
MNIDMTIYNLVGEKIKNISITQNKTVIDRINLCNGIYFYKIKTRGEEVANGKLIVTD